LAASVPSVAYWSLAELPKYLTPEQITAVLKHSEQGNATVQRDRAILLLLARLGLRASEVVRMRLADIDWEAGELTIHGKGGREARLPLPRDVGQCLSEYLRRIRPRCACREVFIRAKAPHQGFADSAAVDIVVQRALRRAGLNPPTKGAHLFRHGLATRMLRNGASLAEIGKVLRHQSASATAIYAKVDLTALRMLAQPWPGGGA
jgi:site-specific recombinase XerD